MSTESQKESKDIENQIVLDIRTRPTGSNGQTGEISNIASVITVNSVNLVNSNETVLNSNSATNSEIVIPKISEETKRRLNEKKMLGCIIVTLLIIIYSAFIVCDIYYGLNDKSCVSQDVERISINLKTFLLVRGFIILGYIANLILSSCLVTTSTIELCGCFQITLLIMVSIFLLAWNIVGAVLFWGYLDKSKCDNPVYNYTFASLIIVFVGSFFNNSSAMKQNKRN